MCAASYGDRLVINEKPEEQVFRFIYLLICLIIHLSRLLVCLVSVFIYLAS